MCVVQSGFLIRRCLGVAIFCKAMGLEVPIRLFVCFNDAFSSLDIEFSLKQLSISQKKSILTSPKLSEFRKKLENSPQRRYFVLGYNNVVL